MSNGIFLTIHIRTIKQCNQSLLFKIYLYKNYLTQNIRSKFVRTGYVQDITNNGKAP